MAWTIDETLKLIKKHTTPFSFLTTDNPQNYYDEEILILEDHLKNISDNKKKIDYLNYFLEKNESKKLNDLFSFYLQWEGIKEDKKFFIDKIKKDEGLISFITRITKEDDYDGYRNFFIQYILIYERILYDIENNTPATNTKTKKQEKKEKRSLKYRMHWEGDESELEKTLKALEPDIIYDNIESALGTGKIELNGGNECITAMAIFFVLAEYKAIKLEAQFAAQIAGVFSGITNKQVNKENGKCGHPFSMVGIEDNFQSLDDTFSKEELRLRKETKKEDNNFQKKEYNIRLFKSCLEHFRKKLLFLKKN